MPPQDVCQGGEDARRRARLALLLPVSFHSRVRYLLPCRKYAKVEKIPGGAIEDSRVLKGVMFEKDVVVPARMRR